MKKELFFIVLFTTLIFSCDENNPTDICGDGKNLCFEVDGDFKAFDGRWYSDSIGYKLYGENIIGVDTTSFLLSIYFTSPTVTSYHFSYFLMSGNVGLVYKENSVTQIGGSGNVQITNVYENKVAGNFDATLVFDTSWASLTNGHLDAIIHQ